MARLNTCVVVLVLCVGLYGGIGVSAGWSNCTMTNRNRPMQVTSMAITPNPVVIPGNIQFSMAGYLTRPLNDTKMVITLKRRLPLVGYYLTLPCIQHIGSCTYPSVCSMLNQMIRENWAGILADVGRDIKQMLVDSGLEPDQCPQPAQTFNIDQKLLTLPRLPRILSWLAEGQYKANVKLTEKSSRQEILCLDIDLPIEERIECTGWFCW